eukprot:m.261728 g.261728  ORF g.261728 m.261728 type:complete len:215 (+) comp42947_c0_seq1:190-834(+)
MVVLTHIARLNDSLPLCQTTDASATAAFKKLAKNLCQQLNTNSPVRCTINASDNLLFHYAIEKEIIYMVLCETQFPTRNAFAFLEDIQKEFEIQHGKEAPMAARPYPFIQFEQYLDKAKRKYTESGATRDNLDKVNTDLMDVHRIMVKNIDQVLERGNQLDDLGTQSAKLKSGSAMYHKKAKSLSWDILLRKWAPVVAILLVILLFLYYRFIGF